MAFCKDPSSLQQPRHDHDQAPHATFQPSRYIVISSDESDSDTASEPRRRRTDRSQARLRSPSVNVLPLNEFPQPSLIGQGSTPGTEVATSQWLKDELVEADQRTLLDHDMDRQAAVTAHLNLRAKFLKEVLEIFPDVAHYYVLATYDAMPSRLDYDHTIAALSDRLLVLQGKYPTERERQIAAEKRKQAASATWGESKLADKENYVRAAVNLLQEEFLRVPEKVIKEMLLEKQNLYSTFLDLGKWQSSQTNDQRLLKRPRPLRVRTQNITAPQVGSVEYQSLLDELNAAKAERSRKERALEAAAQALKAEADNLEESRSKGQVRDCGCCFMETACNRMVHCAGDEPHQFCRECLERHTENLIGMNKCRPTCVDTSGCDAEFLEHQLRLCLSERTMARLLLLKQKDDLKQAGLEGLEECPFCDYMDVCPAIAVDREFKCQNLECSKTSCRLCQQESHIPFSCDKAAEIRRKENAIDARHIIEEAMTEAMVRVCNKCKQKFIKEAGCNKMRCQSCGNTQCYVCSQSIKDYQHFSRQSGDGRCPTHDDFDVEVRHQDEIKKAEASALAKVQAERPDLNAEDLALKVSKEVKESEEARQRRWSAMRPHAIVNRVRPAAYYPQPPLLDRVQNDLAVQHPALAQWAPVPAPAILPTLPSVAAQGLAARRQRIETIRVNAQAEALARSQYHARLQAQFQAHIQARAQVRAQAQAQNQAQNQAQAQAQAERDRRASLANMRYHAATWPSAETTTAANPMHQQYQTYGLRHNDADRQPPQNPNPAVQLYQEDLHAGYLNWNSPLNNNQLEMPPETLFMDAAGNQDVNNHHVLQWQAQMQPFQNSFPTPHQFGRPP